MIYDIFITNIRIASKISSKNDGRTSKALSNKFSNNSNGILITAATNNIIPIYIINLTMSLVVPWDSTLTILLNTSLTLSTKSFAKSVNAFPE